MSHGRNTIGNRHNAIGDFRKTSKDCVITSTFCGDASLPVAQKCLFGVSSGPSRHLAASFDVDSGLQCGDTSSDCIETGMKCEQTSTLFRKTKTEWGKTSMKCLPTSTFGVDTSMFGVKTSTFGVPTSTECVFSFS
jgi:hypothetical protein